MKLALAPHTSSKDHAEFTVWVHDLNVSSFSKRDATIYKVNFWETSVFTVRFLTLAILDVKRNCLSAYCESIAWCDTRYKSEQVIVA